MLLVNSSHDAATASIRMISRSLILHDSVKRGCCAAQFLFTVAA